jgi:ribonuclease P protein subunit RPR2
MNWMKARCPVQISPTKASCRAKPLSLTHHNVEVQKREARFIISQKITLFTKLQSQYGGQRLSLRFIAKGTMAKAGKSNKSGIGGGIPQKHLHSRISYLYQAAVYLSAVELNVEKESQQKHEINNSNLLRSGQSEKPLDRPGRLNHHHTLSEAKDSTTAESESRMGSKTTPPASVESSAQTHQLLSSMRSISQKSQIRLSQSIKRSVCRRCNALLTLNSTAEIQNPSREGRKHWADVLVVTCSQCGFMKRYPIGMGRAPKQMTKERFDDAAATSKAGPGDVKHAVDI